MNKNNFQNALSDSIKLKSSLITLYSNINKIILKMTSVIRNGGKVFICGNGGSAADAQHLAAEFLVRLRPNINRKPFPVISLLLDTSTITACANDFNFNLIFSRNLEALATKKDMLITLSTSGKSKNIINVLKLAKKKKIFSVGFFSNIKSKKKIANIELNVPSKNIARIQESHIFLGHYILECVENNLINQDK